MGLQHSQRQRSLHLGTIAGPVAASAMAPARPCDHFGVGTSGNPTKTTYSWLLESSPGVLTTANGVVQLPAPVWDVIPDPNPAAPPQVVAQVEAPEPPEGFEFGEALWVKVFTTEFEDPTELEDLVGDNVHVQEAETEIEWQLLQKDFNNPDSGKLESGYGVPVGPNAASILRRYEFYEFSGVYDPETHEAQFEPRYGDSHPGPNDVGIYLGSQNAAVNLGPAVPEPQTCALLLAGFGLIGAVARRRKAGGSLAVECLKDWLTRARTPNDVVIFATMPTSCGRLSVTPLDIWRAAASFRWSCRAGTCNGNRGDVSASLLLVRVTPV